jgi:hypothetical protein
MPMQLLKSRAMREPEIRSTNSRRIVLKIPTDLSFPMVDAQLEPGEAPFCTIDRLWYVG